MKPPLLYMDEECKPFREVYSLINVLTDYYSNETRNATLLVTNNEWQPIPDLPGCRKRKDITFPLNKLTEIHIKLDKIIFKCKEKEYSINISKDFFYIIEEE